MFGKIINGYTWFSFEFGIHAFIKNNFIIECTENQIYNGDIEFMTENGWTIGKELKKKAITTFKKNQK